MKITFISLNDALGGAAIVTRRLAEKLRDLGHEVYMVVAHKTLDLQWIIQARPEWKLRYDFLAERLGVFMRNGFDRGDLFKVSTATHGMDLMRMPEVSEADVVVVGWFNQGLLSLDGLRHILAAGKKTVWMMHDMWAFTGICHHAGECARYSFGECGECPMLHSRAASNDISHRIWHKKKEIYRQYPIKYLAVSNWQADKARSSSLLRGLRVDVLHNGLDLADYGRKARHNRQELDLPKNGRIIAMGAARLDDPVKGLPVAVATLNRVYDSSAGKDVTAVFFGALKNPDALAQLQMPYVWLGPITDPKMIESIYIHSDVVLSSSAYETFGATLCEGMACGCVPVAFARGGQCDIISHLDTGYLAQPDDVKSLADGILWALNTEIPESRLKERARMFDLSHIAGEFLTLIR